MLVLKFVLKPSKKSIDPDTEFKFKIVCGQNMKMFWTIEDGPTSFSLRFRSNQVSQGGITKKNGKFFVSEWMGGI